MQENPSAVGAPPQSPLKSGLPDPIAGGEGAGWLTPSSPKTPPPLSALQASPRSPVPTPKLGAPEGTPLGSTVLS